MEITAASRQAAPHAPVKDEHHHQHGDKQGDGTHDVRQVVGQQGLRVGRRRVQPPADEAGGVGVEKPSGAFITWATPCLRMLDAVRKAARWVHIKPAKYRMMPATAKANASQPYWATL